jgi:hypothetical protein
VPRTLKLATDSHPVTWPLGQAFTSDKGGFGTRSLDAGSTPDSTRPSVATSTAMRHLGGVLPTAARAGQAAGRARPP